METGVYQIELKDGRLWRVFYANSSQKLRLMRSVNSIKNKIDFTKTITNGIHTVKQWEKQAKLLKS